MYIPDQRMPLTELTLNHNDSEMVQYSEHSDQEQEIIKKQLLKFDDSFEQILTGFFPKKTLNMTWKDRYFCLTPIRLIYYSTPKKEQLKGCFNLVSLIQYDLRVQSTYPIITLTVSVPTTKYVEAKQLIKLEIQQRKAFHQWRDTLSTIINNQKKQKQRNQYPSIRLQQISNPKKSENFWNKLTISQKQFQCYADHLDIVLFRSKENVPSFQRLLMRSYYDHVGIVIKDEIDQIFILQAIQSRGVWITPWSQMLPVFKNCYEQIGYRKLIKDPHSHINQNMLQSLLNKLIGKKYELSIKKLISIPDTEITEFEQNLTPGLKKQEKTYFCSELIAHIYLKLGLLRNRKRNQFWPKDFEENLLLEKKAKLSPIMLIQI